MATNTYVAIDTRTLTVAAPTITFSNIPQNYTDLVLVFECRASSANMNWDLRVGNGTVDSGSNYSATYLVGGSGGVTSNRVSNQDRLRLGFSAFIQSSGGVFTAITQFMNYSNTAINKTVISRDGNANQSVVESASGLWRSNSAINIIEMGDFGGTTMAIGTKVSLYGIAAEATSPAPKATGGAIYDDALYYYHVFGSTGVFTPSASLSCDYVIVAGGGGSGYGTGGGGGAGGFRSFTSQTLSATNYPVTIGGGGGGATNANTAGGDGTNSSFNSLSSTGGGGGGSQPGSGAGSNGRSGGSGGGASRSGSSYSGGSGNLGGYTPVEGFGGGNNQTAASNGCGGGGGAGGAGVSGTTTADGAGGVGATSSLITAIVNATGVGQLVSGVGYLAGGGGGGGAASGTKNGAAGGLGGGANGGAELSVGNNGTANTGGGAGGAGFQTGGNGGSGVVVVRYLKV